jgi:hypothetical protein
MKTSKSPMSIKVHALPLLWALKPAGKVKGNDKISQRMRVMWWLMSNNVNGFEVCYFCSQESSTFFYVKYAISHQCPIT